MLIVAYFIAGCFKEMLVSAPWRWRANSAETCRSYAKDSTCELWNSEFVGVARIFCFIIIHRMSNAKPVS